MSNKKLIEAATKAGFQFINLQQSQEVIPDSCIDMLTIEVAERNRVIVVSMHGLDLVVVVEDPKDWDKMNMIREILEGFKITFYITSPEDMDFVLKKYYIDQLVAG